MATNEQLIEQNKTSLQRQRKTRDYRDARSSLRDQERKALSGLNNTADKRKIKEAFNGAVYDLDTSYKLPSNKDDYESDITERGIDQFTAPEATPESGPESGGGLPDGYVETDVIICVNGSPVSGQFLFKEDTQ